MLAFRGVQQGTVVGQEGLEYYYDRYLRGKPGERRVQVNAFGEAEPTKLTVVPPVAGHSLRLSLDLGLEQEGEKALREGIAIARAGGKPANGGAYVAMDPRNGQVLATGSYPSFNPNVFAKPMTHVSIRSLDRRQRSWWWPAVRSSYRRRLSDRLDLQADHGYGGARSGSDHPERRSWSWIVHRSRAKSSSATPATPTMALATWLKR